MADKQIGIRLDVKQTGLNEVGEGLDDIKKSIKSMDGKSIKGGRDGWGSEALTKELREQIRYMQQMLTLQERMSSMGAKVTPPSSSGASGRGSSDTPKTPSYRTGALGGYVHERFGEKSAQTLDKLAGAVTKLGTLYAGFNLLSSIHSGMQRGDQLGYGYADVLKRMNPSNTNAMSYTRDMARSLQGYGYDDLSVVQSATNYGNVTGRMDPKQFKSQMQAIESTGQRYGWDLGQTTQYFSDAYQNGVTGGSSAQMNPQQFATLVANATVQAHMQGKEAQMMQQFSQVAQMSMQSMGQTGDAKTISALLAMADKTGNQAIIGNAANMLNGVNQGITNPSGGYAGQSMMMRAIGGGKMGFFQEQFLQSQGAFGQETDASGSPVGPTNIEKATNYLMDAFKGDKYRQYSMLGQMFNMKPAQAKQFIDTYTQGGKFKSDALDQLKNQMDDTPTKIDKNDIDKYRTNMTEGQTGTDLGGVSTLPERSAIEKAKGSILGGGLGHVLEDLGIGAGGLAIGAKGFGLYKGIKSLFGKGTKVASKAAGTAARGVGAAGGATAEAAATAEGTLLLPEVAGAGTAAEGILGAAGAMEVAGAGMDATGVGLPLGVLTGIAGLGVGAVGLGVGAYQWWKNRKKSTNPSTGAMYDPPAPASAFEHSDQSTAASASLTGADLAPIVVSTIIALEPYMSQIRSVIDKGTDGAAKNVPYNGSAPAMTNPIMTPGTNSAFKLLSSGAMSGRPTLAAYGKSGGRSAPSGGSSGGSSGSYTASSAIDYWAKQYGIPDYVAYSIASAESDLNPDSEYAESNGTTSYGLYQLNSNGQGAGYSPDQLKDPMTNAQIGLKEIGKAYQKAKEQGVEEGPGMAERVAENSGHPGYGVHSELDDKIYNRAQGILNGSIKIDGGSIDVNIKTDSGTQTVKAPITAEYTGISA